MYKDLVRILICDQHLDETHLMDKVNMFILTQSCDFITDFFPFSQRVNVIFYKILLWQAEF